jgi:aminoglycoside phosphotransferase (APT) family kinase protein
MTLGLARMFPEYIPAPVAVATYPDQGWMLLRSFEGEVMWEPTVEQKEDVLRITARIQIEAASRIDGLFAAGCVDFRLDKLPARVAILSRDDVALAGITPSEREKLSSLLPSIVEACDALASGPIPQSLMHGDLHGGNIMFHEGHYTIFDWTDGCVTHPFFDLLTFLDPADPNFDHLRDLYLSEWSSFAPLDTLRETFDIAITLGGLHHALSYRTINANAEPPMVTELQGALEYFLRRYLSP